MSDPVTVLRRLLPPAVAVAGGRIDDLQGPLWPAEEPAVATARPARLADFVAGRTVARAALATLGQLPAPLPRDPRGPVMWPAGLTGSLSHGGGWALAAIAPAMALKGIGIDIDIASSPDPGLLDEIAGPAERAALPAGPEVAMRVFSAKEVVYKAQFPLSGVMLGFGDLAVTLTADGFTARFLRPAGPFAAGAQVAGRQRTSGALIVSALWFCGLNGNAPLPPRRQDRVGKWRNPA